MQLNKFIIIIIIIREKEILVAWIQGTTRY